MLVICLEGCHGAGKSQLIESFKSTYGEDTVLDEAFMDMESWALEPQTLTMELRWVSQWFTRLLKLKEQLGDDAHKQIFFADRSPYSAVFYSRTSQVNRDALQTVIAGQIDEIRTKSNIHVVTVHLSCEPDALWARIQERLTREPFRRQYMEHKVEWMKQTLAWYTQFGEWDITIDNTTGTAGGVLVQLAGYLSKHNSLSRFSDSLTATAEV
ncbi:hypothetical protein KIPB_002968 [Kipferlia bialata]|uniref:NadR/Ttd14 AAA domain-containing protein n=1 Tax=Kipferlia bialata TaxID=797122 RepID=A0A9K3CRG5_9EUKA|nr:hypothetical protein KIPB_002968 [Kipferlia bialata]|eukprot:g2968.t1